MLGPEPPVMLLMGFVQITIVVSTDRVGESVCLKDTRFFWVRKLHPSWETAPEQEEVCQHGTLQPRTMPNSASFYPSLDLRQLDWVRISGALPLETVLLFGSWSPRLSPRILS